MTMSSSVVSRCNMTSVRKGFLRPVRKSWTWCTLVIAVSQHENAMKHLAKSSMGCRDGEGRAHQPGYP